MKKVKALKGKCKKANPTIKYSIKGHSTLASQFPNAISYKNTKGKTEWKQISTSLMVLSNTPKQDILKNLLLPSLQKFQSYRIII